MDALTQALDAAGSDGLSDATSVDFDSDKGTVTATYDDGTEVVWQDFQYDADGKVLSWSTAGTDTQLSERLWTESSTATTKHAKVTLISAYRNDAGLHVVLDELARDRALTPDCSPVLTDSKKRQRQASECNAPDSIAKGTSAYVALFFKNADFGGTLKYQILSKEYDTLATVTLRIG